MERRNACPEMLLPSTIFLIKAWRNCIQLIWFYYFSWNTALDKKSSHGDRIICMTLISIWIARLRMRICAWSLIRLIKSGSAYVRRRHLNKMQALGRSEADVQYKSTLVSLLLKMWSINFYFIFFLSFYGWTSAVKETHTLSHCQKKKRRNSVCSALSQPHSEPWSINCRQIPQQSEGRQIAFIYFKA